VASPDVFVIACNTASTLALEEVRAALDIPVIGTVPAIKPAAALTRTGTIGLLATPGTIKRDYTHRLIADYASEARVITHGSIALVELAEAVARGETPPLEAFRAAQQPMFETQGGHAIDVVVLACTHFPLVREQLIETALVPARYIDSGEAIAAQTLRVLGEGRAACSKGGRVFLTDESDQYQALAAVFQRFGFDDLQTVTVPIATSLTG
jgi:glutamate racemase